ncbi:hypothetical protein QYM36_019840, partial [Artemia franciscana]
YWNVNFNPEFLILHGRLVKIYLTTYYLDNDSEERQLKFEPVEGSYVYEKGRERRFDENDTENLISDFAGRSLALYRDDSYLQRDARYTLIRMKVYCESLARYGEPGTLWLAMATLNHEDCLSIGRDPGGIAK